MARKKCTIDANNIRLSAISYTDDMLANLEQIMSTAINDSGEKYRAFLTSVQSCYDVVTRNRSELSPQVPASSGNETDDITFESDDTLDDEE